MPLHSAYCPTRRSLKSLSGLVLLGLLLPSVVLRGQEEPQGLQIFYLVLALEEEGPPKLVHASTPTIPHLMESLPLGLFEEARQEALTAGKGVAVTVFDSREEPVFFRIYPILDSIRGEFHGEPLADGGWSIEGVAFDSPEVLSVVRVPALQDSRVLIETRTGLLSLDSFELFESPPAPQHVVIRQAEAPSITLKSSSQGMSEDNRVDLLIMGDGYTQAQQQKFLTDAASFEQHLLSITPYSQYRNYVRVTKLFLASQQSGADHPPYNPSCVGDNPACCGDAVAQTDPLAGTYVNTALGSRYCAFNVHRLLVPSTSAVLAAASTVATWDQIVVLVNDLTYGGSGNAGLRISATSLEVNASEIVRHEYGHTFTNLADEYDSSNPGFPACSDISGTSPCEANVTDVSTFSPLKWKPWVPAGLPIPTPEGQPQYQNVVGLFEGARYLTSGMYRPRDENCLMHNLGKPFGEVCRQEYVLRLYSGGWGQAPLSGIRTIEPGSAKPEPISFKKCSGALTFSVATLQPVGGPAVAIQWFVDGVPVSGATSSNFTYSSTAPASNVVTVRVKDTTSFVHADMENGELTSQHLWGFNTVSLPTTLTLQSQNVVQTEVHEACDTILAGPALVVKNGGDLTLQAGSTVVLRNGFRVESGGSLTIITDPVFPN